MHDIYGTEIYLKYHREDLEGQAEQERQIMQAKKLITGKAPGQPGKRTASIQVDFSRNRQNTYRITFITGEQK